MPFIGSRHLTSAQQQMVHTALKLLVTHDGALLGQLRITDIDPPNWLAYQAILDFEASANDAGVPAFFS